MTSKKIWVERIESLQERLKQPLGWYPYSFFISFGLVAIFTGQVVTKLNPRLGHPVQLMTFDAPEEREGSIWLSVSFQDEMDGGKIVVTTSERKVFTWNNMNRGSEAVFHDPGYLELITYLKNRVKEEITSVGLSMRYLPEKTLVVLAVDQRLQYKHIRPLLYAFGEAQKNRYAFETHLPLKDQIHKEHM